jgi:hypothetical protein
LVTPPYFGAIRLFVSSPTTKRASAINSGSVVDTTVRILTFRATREELESLGVRHLVVGLIFAWIVGIGRYYDNDRVGWLQHLGVGSVVYVLLLSLFLWLIIWPLRPRSWSYLKVAAFISLVSPPAILYAIPLEFLFSVEIANTWNAIFLAIVATWRVALLIFFLRRLGRLDWLKVGIATMLPLTIIVVTLTVLNLEKVVFNLMGGLREPTANDASYTVLVGLTYLSLLMFIPLVICYGVLVARTIAARRNVNPYWPEGMDE